MRLLKLVETRARLTRAPSEPAPKYGSMQVNHAQAVVNHRSQARPPGSASLTRGDSLAGELTPSLPRALQGLSNDKPEKHSPSLSSPLRPSKCGLRASSPRFPRPGRGL